MNARFVHIHINFPPDYQIISISGFTNRFKLKKKKTTQKNKSDELNDKTLKSVCAGPICPLVLFFIIIFRITGENKQIK